MANRECNGDIFTANHVRYYRCLWDGTIIQAPLPGQKCSVCDRKIDATDIGLLRVQTIYAVRIPNGALAFLPANAALTGAPETKEKKHE